MSKKFKIATLGCRTNQYESQAYKNQLEALGYTAALSHEEADVCIVNTCTVTESAHKESKLQVRQLIKKNPHAKMVVTGCASEKSPELIQEISGVSLVVPNKDKDQLVERLFPEESVPEFAINNFDAHTRAFVKVQDGCNSFCTYCIIPYVRGRSKSRTMESIVQEVEGLIANGYKEVVLTGINIGDFDGAKAEGKSPERLAHLVKAIDAIPGLERLRLSSIDPDEVDEELADVILLGKKTCPSMHIVLQSGSNVILKRMNRKYTRQIFLDTVEKLRRQNPDFTFTTDVIVGFPGESESDLQDTIDVMRRVKFAKVHMFPYSVRSRTRAALFPNKVAPDVIKERKSRIIKIAEETAFELRSEYLGREMWVLTESRDNEDLICGSTANFLPVMIYSKGLQPNTLVRVRLIESLPEGLVGELL
ncbi:MAG: tRNA (N(6)-L-threonylcarbamoyladenosine(37)-C(2))-methylthiotransferase MtaB [Chlamydiales bacterium]|nr:tRNA (N(6)-L-threonylcarbamoyladenosine(37)-C(2))-methylthiotransferase MtaB [Chlamydiales bacterium]